jgi:2-polyprenyl-3-methyl-5-hydroxy-6-metoxy-1,4-benzoquinol methylase
MIEICPLCRAPSIGASRFGLRRCSSCGLIMDPAIFQPGAAESLNETAFSDTYEPERSFWVRWFNAWKDRRYLRYLRNVGKSAGELLEIGVGNGSFLCAAQADGFTVTGCDLSEAICRKVEQSFGIPMHRGRLDTLPEHKWDVVVMNHVLEHVHDPVGFLRMAGLRLKPGGVLHIAVPNVACWEARLRGWNSYEPYHLAYFNAKTLEKVLCDAGFAIVHQHTHDSFSAWFLALLRTIRKPHHVSVQRTYPARSLTRQAIEHAYRLNMVAAGALTWPLRATQGWLGYGDELIAIAKL